MNKLEVKTAQWQDFCGSVARQIDEEGIVEQAADKIIDLVRRRDVFFRGIAAVVEQTAGRRFARVVYPCVGTDLLTPVAFHPAKVIGIDMKDPFVIPGKVFSPEIRNGIMQKLVYGLQHYTEACSGLNFAIELKLMGIDPSTLVFQDQQKLSQSGRGVDRCIVQQAINLFRSK